MINLKEEGKDEQSTKLRTLATLAPTIKHTWGAVSHQMSGSMPRVGVCGQCFGDSGLGLIELTIHIQEQPAKILGPLALCTYWPLQLINDC